MSPTIRTLLASVMIAAVAPIGLAVLDLEQPALAGNGHGGGNGGGHGGNGGGHGGGNGGGHGGSNHADHGNKSSKADAKAEAKAADADAGENGEESEGLAPNELGKLNGVLHASPNAISHASANSPIGAAREFGEALAGFLDSAEEAPAEGEETADDEAPIIDQLGEMMAHMTNKPVTADQVQAVAEKVGIETTDEAPADEDTTEDTTAGDEPPALDQATAQEIADKANEIHGFDTGDDTADAGETADDGEETVAN